MPPKAKFTRDEILDLALCIAMEQGIDAITARELGTRLGSSARPIFTVFANMDEVKELVIRRAKDLYGQYVEEGLRGDIAFRGVGIAYIRFATEQPKLFQLLFMQESDTKTDITGILPVIDAHYDEILESVQNSYALNKESAERFYQHLWIYTHGIATMLATGLCTYTMEQIEERLSEMFRGMILFEKGSKKHD